MELTPTVVEVGKSYLFHGRMIYIGTVVDINLRFYTIKNVGWMATMGRDMAELLKEGPNEDTLIEWTGQTVPLSVTTWVPFLWDHEVGE